MRVRMATPRGCIPRLPTPSHAFPRCCGPCSRTCTQLLPDPTPQPGAGARSSRCGAGCTGDSRCAYSKRAGALGPCSRRQAATALGSDVRRRVPSPAQAGSPRAAEKVVLPGNVKSDRQRLRIFSPRSSMRQSLSARSFWLSIHDCPAMSTGVVGGPGTRTAATARVREWRDASVHLPIPPLPDPLLGPLGQGARRPGNGTDCRDRGVLPQR